MKNRNPKASPRKVRRTLKILQSVKNADEVRLRSRRRNAPHKFLKSVFRAYLDLQHRFLLRTLPNVVSRQYSVRLRDNWHPIRLIIEASTQEREARVKSRWTRALESAEQLSVPSEEIVRYFRRNHGIAGCANHAARTLPKRKRIVDHWADDYEEVD